MEPNPDESTGWVGPPLVEITMQGVPITDEIRNRPRVGRPTNRHTKPQAGDGHQGSQDGRADAKPDAA